MKNKHLVAVFALLVCIAAIAVPGKADDSKKILKDLQKKYESLQDMNVKFKQEIEFGVTKNTESFEGTMLIKKGNKYRIELEHQTIVTDGTSVWSYSPDNGQVIIDKFHDDPKAITPDKVLVNVPDRYNTTLLSRDKSGDNEIAIVKLTPKDENSNVQWMKLWIDTDDWVLRKVQFQDLSDNITTYTVSDLKVNTGLTEKQFQFDPPKDAQVIDLR